MNSTSVGPVPLFIDCDTGIDDALAIAYLLAEPSVRVVGIGTVSGNTHATKAAQNTLALLELAGRTDIPVAVGMGDPVRGAFGGGAPEIHGVDGAGDIGLRPTRTTPVSQDAVQLLAQLALEWGGSLRVLALGPLTNLAAFLSQHRVLETLIEDVVVMGGAFTASGNVSNRAEANIYHDPEAAALVLAASWPVCFLPLDITMQHLLTEAETDDLGRIPGALPRVLATMLDFYLNAYERLTGHRRCALHDPLAAIVAAGAVSVVGETRGSNVHVVTDGSDRGRTIATPSPRAAWPTRHRIVSAIDARAADVLISALRAHAWPVHATEPERER